MLARLVSAFFRAFFVVVVIGVGFVAVVGVMAGRGGGGSVFATGTTRRTLTVFVTEARRKKKGGYKVTMNSRGHGKK